MPSGNAASGTNNPGAFNVGFDPRRVTPTKRQINRAIEELCKEHAGLAVACLAGLISDPEQDGEVRRKASNDILDRAYGKAVDRIAIAQVGGDQARDARLLSTEDIIRMLTPKALENEGNEVFIPAHSDAIESGYIVVGDQVADGSGLLQPDSRVAAHLEQPGAWPWSDTEQEAASNQADDDRRSETTPLGDLK